MNRRNVAKNDKNYGRNKSNGRKLSATQKIIKRDLSSNPTLGSSPKFVVTSIVWTIIVALFQIIQDLLVLIVNYFWNIDNEGKVTTRKEHPRVSVSVETCDVDTRVKDPPENITLKKKQERISQRKLSPNVPQKVDAFTSVNLWLGGNDVATQSMGFSSMDSGIGSRPVSRADTNETSSECCTEESTIPYTSHRRRSRLVKRYTRSDYGDPSVAGSDACHVSRELTRARQGSSVASCRLPIHRSVRQDMSITRHIVRVRNGRNKRAKSAVTFVRQSKPESETESRRSNSTFYEDYNEFY